MVRSLSDLRRSTTNVHTDTDASPTADTDGTTSPSTNAAEANQEPNSTVVFEVPGVCLYTQPQRSSKSRLPGRLKIVHHAMETYLLWEPETTTELQFVAQPYNYAIKHILTDIKAFKRRGAMLKIIPTSGAIPPPLFFESGRLNEFGTFLQLNYRIQITEEEAKGSIMERALEMRDSVMSRIAEFRGHFSSEAEYFKPYHSAVLDQPDTESGDDDDVACRLREDAGDLGSFDVLDRFAQTVERPECQRGDPLTVELLQSFCDEHGNIVESAELRKVLFHGGATNATRREAWSFLFNHRRPEGMAYAEWRRGKEEEYLTMKRQWTTLTPAQIARNQLWRSTLCSVQKDVERTDRNLPFFASENNPALQQLHDILVTHCVYNADLGYSQGMNDLLAIILMVMQDEVDAFWCFANMMEKMKDNFALHQIGMTALLSTVAKFLRFLDPALMDYLEAHDSADMFFCFRWLIINFKREFPFDDVLVLWEALWSEWESPSFRIFVCLAMIDLHKETIVNEQLKFDGILQYANSLSGQMDVQEVLLRAEALCLQCRAQIEALPEDLQPLVLPWQ
eukprot:m.83826 g.83826  ORF g.83826 m.83826 type:complete len:566 (-) comp14777_c0_seq1:133-1830(-)